MRSTAGASTAPARRELVAARHAGLALGAALALAARHAGLALGAALALGAGFALGCNLDARHQLTLQLSTANTCVRTSLACGGEVGVFVADAKTDEVLDVRCVSFAADAALTLEKLPALLAGLSPPLPALSPGRSVVVEVAAYSPATGKSCPRFSATAAGNPAVPSYFGRSGASTVGAAVSIGVSLQCLPSACIACTKFATPAPAPAAVDPADGGAVDARGDGRTDGGAPDESASDGASDVSPGDGSAGAPYRSAVRLVAALAAGQTGCLGEGTYTEDVTFAKGGSGANPVTLAAAPGARAVLKGVLTVPDTTDNIAIVNLVLDGATAAKSPGPLVRGDHVALRGNDITNAGADCVTLGDPIFGISKLAVLEGNRIHGCKAGVVARVAEAGVVAHNLIFDNAGDGVSFFPNGDSFTVEHNVIDGNAAGVLFGSDGKTVSINDTVRLNVISNSTVGYNVYSAFPATAGTGNAATQNCLWMGAKGDVATPMKGFSVKDNVVADPMFVDRAGKDFHLLPGSPCLGFGPLR